MSSFYIPDNIVKKKKLSAFQRYEVFGSSVEEAPLVGKHLAVALLILGFTLSVLPTVKVRVGYSLEL